METELIAKLEKRYKETKEHMKLQGFSIYGAKLSGVMEGLKIAITMLKNKE